MKGPETTELTEIGAAPRKRCFLCGSEGRLLHADLRDRLFGAPGQWTFTECTNPECGLVWLDPMPLEAELAKAYRTYYTHQLSNGDNTPNTSVAAEIYRAIAKGHLRRRGYRRGVGPGWYGSLWPLAYLVPGGPEALDARALFLSAPAPGARLLDIGCGDGVLLRRFEQLGWKAEGVEIDPDAVAAGRAQGLSIAQGDVESQHYAASSFDAVTMNHVIEHVADPARVLKEINRILKVGGRLVLVTPNVRSWGHARFGEDWRGLEPPRHLHLFTVTALRSLVLRAGMRVIAGRTVAKGVPSIWSASRGLRRSRLAETKEPAAGFAEPIRDLVDLLYERALLLRRPEAGEETVLIAERVANALADNH
jgi:2-polyprenyl-3-methyl-5-hydroxy-6-metoxy-1,4-benzoquinol methylase